MNKMHVFLAAALILGSAAFAQEATPAAAAAPEAAAPAAEPAAPAAAAPEAAPAEATPATAEPVAAEPAATEPVATTAVAEPAANDAAVTTAVAEPAPAPAPEAEVAAAQEPEVAPQEAPAEKVWFSLLNVGFTFPFSKYNINSKKADFINYGMEFSYIGMARNGFSIEASFAGGGSATDNIKFEDSDDDWQIGKYTSFDFGLGYTFGAGSQLSLSVLATIGYEIAYFETEDKKFTHDELGKIKRNFSETIGGLTLGTDVILYKGLSNHAGFYASVGARWIAYSEVLSSVNYKDTKNDFTRTETYTDEDSGLFSIVPSFGAMFSF